MFLIDTLLEKFIIKISKSFIDKVIGKKEKRKLAEIIDNTALYYYRELSNTENREGIKLREFFKSKVEEILRIESNYFIKLILKLDENSFDELKEILQINNNADETQKLIALYINRFCFSISESLIEESTNSDSCLFNIIQVLNIDILKLRMKKIVELNYEISKKIDNLYSLINPKKNFDLEMNQGVKLKTLSSIPPETSINNFINQYYGETNETFKPFGGRENYINTLNEWLESSDKPSIAVLTAEAGRGKSAIMVNWYLSLVGASSWNVIFIPISIREQFNKYDEIFPFLLNQFIKVFKNNLSGKVRLGDVIDDNLPIGYEQAFIAKIIIALNEREVKTLLIFDGLDEITNDLKIKGFFDTINQAVEKNNCELKFVKIICTARHINTLKTTKEWANYIGLKIYEPLPNLSLLNEREVFDILVKTKDPLNKLKDLKNISKELSRLSSGEPLLIKLYIDELLLKEKDELLALTLKDLYNIKPGYEGYISFWLKDSCGDDGAFSGDISCLMFILSYAKMPLYKHEIKNLFKKIMGKEIDLQIAIKIIKRLLYNDSKVITFCHPALAIYLTCCETSECLEVDIREKVYIGYLEWLEDSFCLLKEQKYKEFPEYLKYQAIEHVIDYHNQNDEQEIDYYSFFLTEEWNRYMYYIDDYYYFYKKHISECLNFYLLKASKKGTLLEIKLFKCVMILSILNHFNNEIPFWIYREIMKEDDDSKRVLKENQIINIIDMLTSESEKLDIINEISPFLSKQGIEHLIGIIIKSWESPINKAKVLIELATYSDSTTKNDILSKAYENAKLINFSSENALQTFNALAEATDSNLNKSIVRDIYKYTKKIPNKTKKIEELIELAKQTKKDEKFKDIIVREAYKCAKKNIDIAKQIEIFIEIAKVSKGDFKRLLLKEAYDCLLATTIIKFQKEYKYFKRLDLLIKIAREADKSFKNKIIEKEFKEIIHFSNVSFGEITINSFNIERNLIYKILEALIKLSNESEGDTKKRLIQNIENIFNGYIKYFKDTSEIISIATISEGNFKKELLERAYQRTKTIYSPIRQVTSLIDIASLSGKIVRGELLEEAYELSQELIPQKSKAIILIDIANLSEKTYNSNYLKEAIDSVKSLMVKQDTNEYEKTKAPLLIKIANASIDNYEILFEVINVIKEIANTDVKLIIFDEVLPLLEGNLRNNVIREILKELRTFSISVKDIARMLVKMEALAGAEIKGELLSDAFQMINYNYDSIEQVYNYINFAKILDGDLKKNVIEKVIEIISEADDNRYKADVVSEIALISNNDKNLFRRLIDLALRINDSNYKMNALFEIAKASASDSGIVREVFNYIKDDINFDYSKDSTLLELEEASKKNENVLREILKPSTRIYHIYKLISVAELSYGETRKTLLTEIIKTININIDYSYTSKMLLGKVKTLLKDNEVTEKHTDGNRDGNVFFEWDDKLLFNHSITKAVALIKEADVIEGNNKKELLLRALEITKKLKGDEYKIFNKNIDGTGLLLDYIYYKPTLLNEIIKVSKGDKQITYDVFELVKQENNKLHYVHVIKTIFIYSNELNIRINCLDLLKYGCSFEDSLDILENILMKEHPNDTIISLIKEMMIEIPKWFNTKYK